MGDSQGGAFIPLQAIGWESTPYEPCHCPRKEEFYPACRIKFPCCALVRNCREDLLLEHLQCFEVAGGDADDEVLHAGLDQGPVVVNGCLDGRHENATLKKAAPPVWTTLLSIR